LVSGGCPASRREEVAQLAGVGVAWYTWLEQGRNVNVSSDVLERLDAALARRLRNHTAIEADVWRWSVVGEREQVLSLGW
jgi:transcriptional regulator with XRE-family HTH domain